MIFKLLHYNYIKLLLNVENIIIIKKRMIMKFSKKNNNDWHITGYDNKNRPIYSKVNKNITNNHVSGSIEAIKSDYDTNTPENTKIPLDGHTEQLLDSLYSQEYEPYLVGGKIRDHIFGKENKDIDIEVYKVKNINNLVETLEKMGAKVDTVGKSFGVIKTVYKDKDYDISLPRKDSLKNNGSKHTDINVQVDPDLSIEEASKRRDFTMNALMYSPIEEKIIDPHGGLEDIDNRILRAVDDKTFIEDPLRALRGVQFAGRFDMDLDDHTIDICEKMTWNNISSERIQGELHKLLLKSTNFHQELNTLYDIKWNDLTPHITKNIDTPLPQHVLDKINNYPITDDQKIALTTSVLDYYYSDSKKNIGKDFMLTSKQNKIFKYLTLKDMSETLPASQMRRTMYGQGLKQEYLENITESLGINTSPRLWDNNPPEYQVNGKTLINKGLKPNSSFSTIISKTQDLQDSGITITNTMLNNIIKENYK